MTMEENKIYQDQKGNKIIVICNDYTGLNRGLVYAQFLDRVKTVITKEEFISKMKNNRYCAHTFAIWETQFKNYARI